MPEVGVQPLLVVRTNRADVNRSAVTKELFRKIDETLKAVRAVVVKPDNSPLTLDEVKKIRDLAKAANIEIADMGAKPDE